MPLPRLWLAIVRKLLSMQLPWRFSGGPRRSRLPLWILCSEESSTIFGVSKHVRFWNFTAMPPVRFLPMHFNPRNTNFEFVLTMLKWLPTREGADAIVAAAKARPAERALICTAIFEHFDLACDPLAAALKDAD